ncbi:MAG: thiamine phosphate synthase [Candidatus Eremiobacteraeota bacterium]|nr:thiamine phosphate synthase [Candidatus Eremiobacteraeota bacterium]
MAAYENAPLNLTQRTALLRGIYAIVNDAPAALNVARGALQAGISIVQYRAKAGIKRETLIALRAETARAGALLIVNDDWRAAIEFDCDGVHLGPEDGGLRGAAAIRAAMGERLLGLSCGTLAEAEAAVRTGADYIGVGSVYATASKGDAGEPIGIEGLRRVAAATPLPVAAIGGIDRSRMVAVAASGVAMAAVISAIAECGDPFTAAAELVRLWSATR